MAHVSKILQREDGRQVKIVATEMFGRGLHRSVDVYVLHRDGPSEMWKLASDRPAEGWKEMPRQQYEREGRAEVLRVTNRGEIFKVVQELNETSGYAPAEAPSSLGRPRMR